MAVPALQYAIGNSASTTLSSSVTNTDTSMDLTSDTNFAAKSGEGMVIVDEGEATEELAYSASKTGATISTPLVNRGLEGGSAQAHSASATIKGILTAGMWNDLIDALTTNLLDQTAGTTKSGIALTSPKVTTGINDANNNELFKVTATASAVNEFTVANAALSGHPALSVTGTDTNINVELTPKGSGRVTSATVNIPTISSTDTLTNKRITKRITTITSHATPTINTDNCDAVTITAQAEAITSMTTNLSGTPTNFQTLIIRIKDDGTGRAITWGTGYEAKGTALPTTTTASKVLTIGFIYDTVTSKWGCVAVSNET